MDGYTAWNATIELIRAYIEIKPELRSYDYRRSAQSRWRGKYEGRGEFDGKASSLQLEFCEVE